MSGSVDEVENYLASFRHDAKNEKLITRLRFAASRFSVTSDEYSMAFLRVTWSNAHTSQPFTNAQTMTEFVQDEDGCVFGTLVGLIFRQGITALVRYLDKENPCIPTNPRMRLALRDLLQYLTAGHRHLVFAESKGINKTELQNAVEYAEHLLIPLTLHKSYKIDHCAVLGLEGCSLSDRAPHGIREDTSFGCPEGWHGRADILIMGEDVPLSCVPERDGSSQSSHSDAEFKKDAFSSKHQQQILARAIMFSFLKRKANTEESSPTLVPVIGICAEKMIVYMYDCVNDFLLEGQEMSLFSEDYGFGIMNQRTVIYLWLVLNYQLFGADIPEFHKMEKYRSGFHTLLGEEKIAVYKSRVTHPCNVNSGDIKERSTYSGGCIVQPQCGVNGKDDSEMFKPLPK